MIKMKHIIQLDEALSNMIAAGEVVENMASVVKELVENALDAESTKIEVMLEDYGLKTIRVSDNGTGILSSELPLAFKRHATSKIRTHHDLYHIASLGFRGEALPSIASVSHLTIESSTESGQGRKLALKNGRTIEDVSSSLERGTIVTVKNLFYNTPARLKHLRSEQRELAFILEHMNKIALSHAHVSFHVVHNQRTLLKTTGDQDYKKIFYQIYDLDVTKNLVPFNASNMYFKISGYLAKPAYNRSQRQHVILIVNKRIIKNNRLVQAVLEGYKSYLPIGKYPIIYLEIKTDPLLIDVNIHPQKLEVKFTEETTLSLLIKETIEKTLRAQDLVARVHKTPEAKKDLNPQLDFSSQVEEEEVSYQNTSLDLSEEPPSKPSIPAKETAKIPTLEYIGQALGTYLLFQNDQGFYLIDQHAAEERIRYEKYLHHIDQKAYPKRTLLVPLSWHLATHEVIAYQSVKTALESFGLMTSLENNKSLKITSVPDWIPENQEEWFAENILKEALNEKTLDKKQFLDQLAIDLACKHSIKANHFITKDEVNHLIKDLNKTKNPYHCPHGRPTMIHFTQYELEKLFKRVQS